MVGLKNDDVPVAGLAEFKKKHGTDWSRPIRDFISLAPSFPGDGDLAVDLGVLVADLEFALRYP